MKMQTGRPLILSEHGIYTKERKIDLFQSEWIRDNRNVFEKDASQIPYFREMDPLLRGAGPIVLPGVQRDRRALRDQPPAPGP
jgi:hypothetical protein